MSQETKAQKACIECEDINVSNRDILGFNFEVRIDKILKNMQINYISNPLQNMALWKRHQGIGSDFKIPSWNWEIEAKYSNAKIFPSWIDRDWIPRFKNGSFRVTVHNRGMKLSTNSLERCFIHDIYLVEIGYLRYVLKGKIKHKSRGNKVLEPTSRNKEYGSLESRSGGFNSEGLNVESPKLSSTLKNKIRWEIRKISKSISETLSIFEPFLTVLSRLWNDTSGNVSLTKRSKTTWRPRSGFQVSFNEIQTRLIPHTYPCKHKIPVFCTEHKKTKYICRLTIDPYKDHLGYLKFYKDRLYCFCSDYGDDLCWLHDYICFNNILRREDCLWSKSKWEEQWIFEENLKKKMKEEMILEKITKDKTRMVKHD